MTDFYPIKNTPAYTASCKNRHESITGYIILSYNSPQQITS
ncbi:hypothetical protein HMPREF1548_04986 [Clostridium sp. KLE 1755]|nr:hypothetical protein HMPREF1548_04986 [Clostridium sp. KLE 1755]